MFAGNLYSALGIAPEARISIRVTHSGLTGRVLTSAGGNRFILPRTCHENDSSTEIVIVLSETRAKLVEYVKELTEPLFMLFEFASFNDEVYTDIVRRFEKEQPT